MKKYILIKADYNDADYVSSKHSVTDEQLAELEPIIAAVKKKRRQNWEDRGQGYVEAGTLTQDQVDTLQDLLPYAPENDEIHSIESIELLVVADEIKLL